MDCKVIHMKEDASNSIRRWNVAGIESPNDGWFYKRQVLDTWSSLRKEGISLSLIAPDSNKAVHSSKNALHSKLYLWRWPSTFEVDCRLFWIKDMKDFSFIYLVFFFFYWNRSSIYYLCMSARVLRTFILFLFFFFCLYNSEIFFTILLRLYYT